MSQSVYIQELHKNTKARMLSTSKLYSDRKLEKGIGQSKWNVACCGNVKGQNWIKLMGQQSLRCGVKEINLYKRLYLNQIAGCNSEKLVSAVFDSCFE
ncbi:hypothetical protein F8M41_010685 [Gigaspora margarita]|uniref:Uncharacterized protein n=1 Tax=Gigaspora margarita TaxID=4874 RepID=A0A8H4EQA0_GIGMA|nr:hypothetical protein F8M41_010685 [Gigaspora margarita]